MSGRQPERMIDDACAAFAECRRLLRLVPAAAAIACAKNRRAEVSGARRREHRLGIARVSYAMVDDVTQELRACQAPRTACRVAMQLPKTFSRRDQQTHAARRRLASLRHDFPPSGSRSDCRSYAFAHAPITNASLTDMQMISSTPLALSSPKCAT